VEFFRISLTAGPPVSFLNKGNWERSSSSISSLDALCRANKSIRKSCWDSWNIEASISFWNFKSNAKRWGESPPSNWAVNSWMFFTSVTIAPKSGLGIIANSIPISLPLILTSFGSNISPNPAGSNTSSIFLITQAPVILNLILKFL